MGSNKKHKSKKHKSHFVEEKVGGADGVKVVLRVPTTKDLTVKYPLEAIARARMETTQKRHKAEKVSHHHSKKKRKHHHEDSSNPNNALRAAGLEDISDDEGATYMEHTHSSKPEYGQDEDSSDLSLNVQIDLERLSLRKHKSPHNERSHSGKEFKKSVNPGATAFSVSPMSVVSHVPSPAEKKRKKKKKHKHSHYRHVDDNAPILHDSTSAGVACEMELMEPVTPPKLEFAPSSMELVDDVSMERAPSVHDEIKQGHEGFERGSCSSGKNINNAQSSQPISEDCVKSTGISPSSTTSSARNSVCFPRTALKFFLRHLLNQICRSDPERVFAEPVTDEIAPGYSKIIKNPMDCYTMRLKIENNEYLTVKEFKEDFILMCNNAMTYNSPETSYYQVAKNLLNVGMKMIQKELSVRPDLHHGLVSSFQPLTLSSSSYNLDYTSQFICSINLSALHQSHVTDDTSLIDVAGEVSLICTALTLLHL
jgi:bromodomain-containing protein 7/9